MDTQKIELLLRAASIGSLKKTAGAFDLTQSGLLYAINSFEKEIGVPLLERTPRGVKYTPQGEYLRPYMKNILQSVTLFEEKAAELCHDDEPTLIVGAYPSYARFWMPDIIYRFQQKHPQAKIHMQVCTEDAALLLTKGTIDCAICIPDILPVGENILLADTQVCAYVPADVPLSPDTPVSLDELQQYQVLIPTYNPLSPGSTELQHWQATLPSTQKLKVSTNEGYTLLSMVSKGLGITFLADIYQTNCPSTVKAIPLSPPIIRHAVLALSPLKPMTPLLRSFIDIAKEYAAVQQKNNV